MLFAYLSIMSNKSKSGREKKATLQIRIDPGDELGAQLAAKLEKVADANGISVNAAANLAVAAGLNILETKLKEVREPVPQAA
jgi:hypothetical protein